MDKETAYALGAALGQWARGKATEPKVLLGMDTRESGPWLAEAVASGLASAGVEPHFAGLLTTPGVAFNTKHGPFVAGVMISASHNPFEDNGLKVFDHSGYKLPDAEELQLEEQLLEIRETAEVGAWTLAIDAEPARNYLDSLAATFPHSLDGMRIVVDCANGAASYLAPELLQRLGADVIAIGDQPDGRNINLNAGALYTEALQAAVVEHRADLGIAFDGDADRAMFETTTGDLVDGDAVLLICARQMKAQGVLHGGVVATVMSNLALEVALRREGIAMTRAAVGDKYVLEEMLKSGSNLGGEQSGHIIFTDFATTGDGMLTALRVLEAIVATGKTLSELVAGFTRFPQVLVNVPVAVRTPIQELPDVSSAIATCESDFAGNGRVLVRFSGTEPLARVMVEGDDEAKVTSHAKLIAATLQEAIGVK